LMSIFDSSSFEGVERGRASMILVMRLWKGSRENLFISTHVA
jgi:hypothetical protein